MNSWQPKPENYNPWNYVIDGVLAIIYVLVPLLIIIGVM